MLSLQFAVNKYYQNKNGNEISVSFLYTCLTGFTAALFFLVMNRFQVAFTPFSILCALGVSLLCLSYMLLGFRIFAIGNFSLYMMFLMLGGMILPFLYGIIFLGDADALNPLSFAARMVGILLMTVSLVVSNVRTGKNGNTEKHKSVIILYVCVFFLNGFVSVISKLHQIEKNRAVVSNNNFVFWTNLFTGIVSGIVLLIICLRKKSAPILAKDFGNGKLMLAVAICAALGGGSYLLQTLCGAPHNVCNEESKLIGMEGNRRIGDGSSIIAGPFFICGTTEEDFRGLTDNEVDLYMDRFKEPEQISPEEVSADTGCTIIFSM